MSLTRFLPTPSDRMGILRSLLALENCVILEYGPAGTTHFSIGLFHELGENQQNRLFTTHMSEDDVVMGDVTRLEKAILEIDQNFAPKVIFVVASSVAAVIGTDIKGVCSYMQERVQARLIAFDQGGFRGDYCAGVMETGKLLAQEVALENPEVQENKVNLLGFSMGSYRAASDYRQLTYLLERAFGFQIGACLCGESSIDAVEQMGGARLNLVLREEGLAAAKILKSRFGTPIVTGCPYGYQGTLDWLEKIAEKTGCPIEPAFRSELVEKIQGAAQYPMYVRMLKQDQARAVLVGEYHTICGIGRFLQELGISVEVSLCTHSSKLIGKPSEQVAFSSREKERLDILHQKHRCLILADDASRCVCPADNTIFRISMPVIRGAQIASHLPLMGIEGADQMLEWVEEYLQTLR